MVSLNINQTFLLLWHMLSKPLLSFVVLCLGNQRPMGHSLCSCLWTTLQWCLLISVYWNFFLWHLIWLAEEVDLPITDEIVVLQEFTEILCRLCTITAIGWKSTSGIIRELFDRLGARQSLSVDMWSLFPITYTYINVSLLKSFHCVCRYI